VPQLQTPNVTFGQQPTVYTREQVSARVRQANPNLQGKELQVKIDQAIANVKKAGKLK
jgi:hypothetical protein